MFFRTTHQDEQRRMSLNIEDIKQFLQGVSIEVTPRSFAKLQQPLSSYLLEGMTVYITHLQGSKLSDTVGTAEKIAEQGFNPVCHIGARNLLSASELDEQLARMAELNLSNILLLAGGGDAKNSPFNDTLGVLETAKLEKYSIKSVGFAGHPEGNPSSTPEKTLNALKIKEQYMRDYPRDYYLITQFCFTAQPVIMWWKDISERFPLFKKLRIGMPGVTNSAALLKHAQNCGVGPSMSFLRNNGGFLRKFFTNSITAPGLLLSDLDVARKYDGLNGEISLHFFPLGAFMRTCHWLKMVYGGDFVLHPRKGVEIKHSLE